MPNKKRKTVLVVQIPCLNEEETLPITINAIPKKIEGIDEIKILVINDGSTDRTVEVAKSLGVQHILDLQTNRGLAYVFMAGLREATRIGADYLINLDADNQYDANDMPKLLKPLIEGQADMAVGERPIEDIETFSFIKKKLQRFGSWVVRSMSQTEIKDTTSGYRALNRKAMMQLYIFNNYTYTHESLLSSRDFDIRVKGVPIGVNRKVLRPSRLMNSMISYITKSGITSLRFFVIYNPIPFFLTICAGSISISVLTFLFFLYSHFALSGRGATIALVFSLMMFMLAILSLMMFVLSDLIRINRKLVQRTLYELREHMHSQDHDTPDDNGPEK